MHKFLLYHGDKLVVENQDDSHGYAIYSSSPLGKTLLKVARDGISRWVLVEDILDDSGRGPFEKLQGSTSNMIQQVLNVGKEWVFRTLFSTGTECVNDHSINTMQAYQTRLKYSAENKSFHVYTQVSGCRDGNDFAYLVKHEFCLKVESGDSEYHTNTPKTYSDEAKQIILSTIIDSMTTATPTSTFSSSEESAISSNIDSQYESIGARLLQSSLKK